MSDAPTSTLKIEAEPLQEPLDRTESPSVANEALWLLAELAGELSLATDLESLQQVLGQRLRWMLDFDRCTLAIREDALIPQFKLLEIGPGVVKGSYARDVAMQLDSWPGRVLKEAKPFYLSDLSQLPPGLTLPAQAELGVCQAAQSLLLLPLQFGQQTIGSLNFSSRRANTFSTAWRNLASLLATQIGGQLGAILAHRRTATTLEFLKQERDFVVQIMQTMGQALVVTDRHKQIEFANPALAQLLGYNLDELHGQSIYNFIISEELTQTPAGKLPKRLAGGNSVTYEARLRRANDELIYVSINEVPRGISPMDASSILIITDLTERRRAEEAQYRQNAYLATLHETALDLLNRLELTEVLEAIVSRAGALVQSNHGFLYLLKEDTNPPCMDMVVGFGHFRPTRGMTVRRGEGLVGKVWQTGEPLALADYQSWPERLTQEYYDSIRAAVGVPLKAGERVVGVVGLAYLEESYRFRAEEIEILRRFAQLASLALDNARLYSAAQRRLMELTTLQGVSQVISSTLGLDEIFDLVVKQINNAFGYELVSIYLRQGDDLVLQAHSGYDHVISRIPLQEGISGRVVRSGQPLFIKVATDDPDFLFAMDGIKQSIITVLRTRNGQIVGTLAVESKGQPVLTEADFALITLLAEQISIAIENVQLFEDLRRSEEKYREVVSSVKEIIGQVDRQGCWVFLNPAWQNLLGYEVSASLGTSLLDYVSKEDRSIVQEQLEAIFAGNVEDSSFETRWVASDGTLKWFEGSSHRALTIQGHTDKIVYTLVDITGRKQAEQELLRTQKLESLGLLAGGIAHDFNNILMAVAGNLGLAKGEVIGADAPGILLELLADSEAAVFRARDLTQQLLTFARGGTPVKKIISLKLLLEETTRFTLRGSKAKSRFDIAKDLWAVEADEGQISQVLNNLVINAEQAMPNGGTIQISARNVALPESNRTLPLKAGDYVEITVSDEGVGISGENLTKIFDPYFTTKPKGSGLGLATSFSIISKHEGLITVQSQPEQGTTFLVYLPASREKNLVAGKPAALVTAKPAAAINGRILVLDDEAPIGFVIKKALSRFGYVVDVVEDGTKAIATYRAQLETTKKPYDLVILDLTIPGELGGKEVIQSLQQLDNKVKAIVASGYSNDSVMSHYRDYGFKAALSKPFRLDELVEKVQEVLADTNIPLD